MPGSRKPLCRLGRQRLAFRPASKLPTLLTQRPSTTNSAIKCGKSPYTQLPSEQQHEQRDVWTHHYAVVRASRQRATAFMHWWKGALPTICGTAKRKQTTANWAEIPSFNFSPTTTLQIGWQPSPARSSRGVLVLLAAWSMSACSIKNRKTVKLSAQSVTLHATWPCGTDVRIEGVSLGSNHSLRWPERRVWVVGDPKTVIHHAIS